MLLKSNIKKVLPVGIIVVFLLSQTATGITLGINQSSSSIELSFYDEATRRTTEEKTWTVMVYSCADNKLENEGLRSLNLMEYVGSNKDVNIIVQFDTQSMFEGAKRYYITQDKNYSKDITSPVLQHLDEPNMGHPNTLSDFVCWTSDQYPAEHYGLIIWDHGNGWRGGTAYDTTNDDYLSIDDLKTAMNTINTHLNKKLDIMLFDACLMAMTEVYYQIQGTTNVCMGSEALIPGIGCPYHMIFDDLQSNPQSNASDLSHYIIDNYMSYYTGYNRLTMAAFKNQDICNLVIPKLNHFATILLQNFTQLKKTIEEAISHTQSYKLSYYKDLYDFANELSLRTQDQQLQEAANQLTDEIENATIALGTTQSTDSYGISIYFPTQRSDYDQQYPHLDLSQSTQWDEFIIQYTKTKHLSQLFHFFPFSNKPSLQIHMKQ